MTSWRWDRMLPTSPHIKIVWDCVIFLHQCPKWSESTIADELSNSRCTQSGENWVQLSILDNIGCGQEASEALQIQNSKVVQEEPKVRSVTRLQAFARHLLVRIMIWWWHYMLIVCYITHYHHLIIYEYLYLAIGRILMIPLLSDGFQNGELFSFFTLSYRTRNVWQLQGVRVPDGFLYCKILIGLLILLIMHKRSQGWLHHVAWDDSSARRFPEAGWPSRTLSSSARHQESCQRSSTQFVKIKSWKLVVLEFWWIRVRFKNGIGVLVANSFVKVFSIDLMWFGFRYFARIAFANLRMVKAGRNLWKSLRRS